jgi:hypothetical protein
MICLKVVSIYPPMSLRLSLAPQARPNHRLVMCCENNVRLAQVSWRPNIVDSIEIPSLSLAGKLYFFSG